MPKAVTVDEDVILLRATTSPDDIHGMIAARAVVTEQGGSTSHAAVVSRALGRPCVVGIGDASSASAGALVTVNGAAGLIYEGALALEVPDERADPRLATLAEWAQEASAVRVIRSGSASRAVGVDLDQALSGGEPFDLATLLNGATSASGAMLSDPDNARVAVSSGITEIVTNPILPALLATIEAR